MNKKLFFYFLLTSVFVFNLNLFSQNNKPVPQTKSYYSSSSMTTDINSFTDKPVLRNNFSDEKKNLLTQLQFARESNDFLRKELIEKRLNEISGTSSVPLSQDPNIISRAITGNKPPFNNEPDYLSTTIIPASVPL